MVRIIEVPPSDNHDLPQQVEKRKAVIHKISIRSNLQNPIKRWNLVANDDFQNDLSRYFWGKKLYYERRQYEWKYRKLELGSVGISRGPDIRWATQLIASYYYDRKKLFVKVSGGYSELRPFHGSTILPFSGPTGSGSVSYKPLRPLELQAFAGRRLNFGVSSPYYVSERYGGAVVIRTGWRVSLRGFGTLGTDSYSTPVEVPAVGLVDRLDDVKEYGGSLELFFTSRIQARFNVTESRYNSNVPGNDRSYFRWSVSLLLGGNLLQ